MLKRLPIGTQEFEKLITKNLIYIDKTAFIYELITSGSIYFLSRPRRFGKSLLISTLEALFSGKKDLFNGLWIQKNTDYAFPIYPVIKIDFSQIDTKTPETFTSDLKKILKEQAERYQIQLEDAGLSMMFRQLIQQVARINNVVVLIDEYDKPLIDHLGKDIAIAMENREILKTFYGILKGQDANLQFVLLTGVSKFSKVGIFSGLNQLNDITMDSQFAGMLGYTQTELEYYFKDHINELSDQLSQSKTDILCNIRDWYNGYQFSDDDKIKVYNPFSTLNLFYKNRFAPHWFESGTPTFLIDLIKNQQYDITVLEEYAVEVDMFSVYELEKINILPILVQTGYLTIKNKSGEIYTLGYPNYEVKNGFISYLSTSLSLKPNEFRSSILQLVAAINKNDMDTFFDITKQIFLEIPYDIQLKEEKYYQSLWYLIIKMIGLKAAAEYKTNRGRVDMVVETTHSVYIFELKINKTPDDALAQIRKKGYADEFLNSNKTVYWIGVNFDLTIKNIESWKSIKQTPPS